MPIDYPLQFEPLWRRYVWGGRRLETVLGKLLPPGDDYAESWEIVDHRENQSRVAAGPLRGVSLTDLVQRYGDDLLGRHHPHDQFPLLLKFLDVHESTSVQVHPNDAQAARLHPPDRGKTEAWFVLHVEPGSRIYAGLREGVDRASLEASIVRGDTDRCLHSFEPAAGDCVLIPAGTVHALGAGLVIAEIQQSSDTTWRLFDWNRVGRDGRPRPLHIQEALRVIDFTAPAPRPAAATPTESSHVQRLIACAQFVVDRWDFNSAASLGGDRRCHIVVPVTGRVSWERNAGAGRLERGQTMLVPAAANRLELQPLEPSVLLDIYLPG
jgi:mannose-6-phosphate isomerase